MPKLIDHYDALQQPTTAVQLNPVPVITTSSGKRFAAIDGEVLLDAALRNGVSLEYSCRTGRCSSCKSRVHSGSSIALHEELGLSGRERDEGWILSCVRAATSDLLLDVTDLGDVKLFPARTVPCRIQSLDQLSPDVLKVELRLPSATNLAHHAGQYVEVIGHGGLRRSYSIANAPRSGKQIELHVRHVPGGEMSEYWFGQAKPDDLLRLKGPLGTFFLRETSGNDLVFLATGTGIAPVKAMLEALPGLPLEEQPRSVVVYWGGRTPADIYWDSTASAIVHCFVPVLSRAGPDWIGTRGYVQHAFLNDGPALHQSLVYACGSNTMIHSARQLLVAAGLPERRFHSDAFVCSAAA